MTCWHPIIDIGKKKQSANHDDPNAITPRSNSSIPPTLFFGFGNFPAVIQRFSVVLPMPRCLASSVPLMYLSPVIEARFAYMAFARQSP